MSIRLYLDEDCARRALVSALRMRAADVLTPAEAGMVEREDADHLDYATSEGRVLYSFNVRDFPRIHTEYLSQGKSHAGIVIGQRGISVGDQMRGLLRLIAMRSAEEMIDQLEYLSAWLPPWEGDSHP
jgi:hypothetical protein